MISADQSKELQQYYTSIFPAEKLFKWLGYDKELTKNKISKREFSFTLPGDIYTRYLSFSTPVEFQERLKKEIPVKIDIGAIYSNRPCDRKSLKSCLFKPLEKEFVLDIDLTDYDDVRVCCQDKDICWKCWKFISIAVKIIDISLKDDFGFQKILWVFSGRRGIHCWISDERARMLSNQARKAIVSFLDLRRGGAEVKRKISLPNPLHPSLERSLKVIEAYFTDVMLYDQGLFAESQTSRIFSLVSELLSALKLKLMERWNSSQQSLPTEKWAEFLKALQDFPKDSMSASEIQAFFMYPRLDINVSVQLNHLLKSPFCVHPSTGKICVPINASEIEHFNPNECPTLSAVISQLAISADPYSTSMGTYLKHFDEFTSQPEFSENQKELNF